MYGVSVGVGMNASVFVSVCNRSITSQGMRVARACWDRAFGRVVDVVQLCAGIVPICLIRVHLQFGGQRVEHDIC